MVCKALRAIFFLHLYVIFFIDFGELLTRNFNYCPLLDNIFPATFPPKKKKKNSGRTNRGYSGGHPAVITAALGVEALFSMRCTHDKIEAAHENNDSKRADHTYIAS